MSTMTDTNFPKWLEQQRNEKGWSQSDLSRAAGISRQVISDYEGYKRKFFDEDILKKIARAFKMPPEHVFRMAGLLPQKADTDEWVEEMNHKMGLLDHAKRPMAERLLNALLEEDKPVLVHKKARAKS